MISLNTPVEYIKGIGPLRAKLLDEAFGVKTARDLLLQLPYRYIDKTNVVPINKIKPGDNWVCIRARVHFIDTVGQKKKRLVAQVTDGSGFIELVWFQGINWIKNILENGNEFLIYGKINDFNGIINLPHPELESIDVEQKGYDRLMPVYFTTEKLNQSKLDIKTRRRIISQIIQDLEPADKEEYLPAQLIENRNFYSFYQSLIKAHFPRTVSESFRAKERFIYEEFFFHQLRLMLIKLKRKTSEKGYKFSQLGIYFDQFYSDFLPFSLTGAQKKVIKEIRKDLGSGAQMNRLLQGDVGSGKTVVALMAAMIAAGNGYQTCLMAPLEILAVQHYQSILKLTDKMDFKVGLLTGSTLKKERMKLFEELAAGEIHLLVGTHAVTEPAVEFKQLGLLIIDEQHRFGVEQRASLRYKSRPLPPHVLVMTATPIPRTLALSLYGDLDVSIIDELPPGRKPIITRHVTEFRRPEMHEFVAKEIKKGRQVFFVFPLIEESEKMDLENLQIGFDRLRAVFPAPEYNISVVHGKMKSKEKAIEMQHFITQKTDILISTTVIEVGVDIPNASVMVIENADRFGLAQLHQLRGRVGRGAEQSYCLLMTNYKLSEDAKKRIGTMVETTDGFKIAEVDMELRGPGNMEGTRQSGKLEFNLADLSEHQALLKAANQDAREILASDPKLMDTKNRTLLQQMNYLFADKTDWSDIG